MSKGTRKLVTVAVLFACAGVAGASVLQWDAAGVTYPQGDTGPVTFTNVDGTGVDITIDWLGDTGTFLTDWIMPGGTYDLPSDEAAEEFAMSALWWANNFAAGQSVSMVISFSEPVTDVNFTLFDIDGVEPNWEKTRLKGFLGGLTGTATLPSLWTVGSDVNVQIVPIGQSQDGLILTNGGAGDTTPPDPIHQAELDFFGPIDTIGIQYSSIEAVDRGQLIGDISFVPEPATMALLALGGLAVLRRRKK